MDTYEAALDTLTMDIKSLEIQKCAYMSCGFTFIDIHSHYWQFHPEFIKQNMRTTNYMEKTVAELQGDEMGQLETNQQEKHDPVVAAVAQPAQD